MGRKKSSKRTTATRRKKKNNTIGLDFIGGILIAIGAILLVCLGFENTSDFALALSEILGGLFGVLKVGLPIVFIIVGIECIIKEKAIYPMTEIVKGIVLVCVLSGTVYSFACDKLLETSTVTSYIKWAWVEGIRGGNVAGLIGGLITSSLASILGIVIKISPVNMILIVIAYIILIYKTLLIALKQLKIPIKMKSPKKAVIKYLSATS